jgi:tricorn protease
MNDQSKVIFSFAACRNCAAKNLDFSYTESITNFLQLIKSEMKNPPADPDFAVNAYSIFLPPFKLHHMKKYLLTSALVAFVTLAGAQPPAGEKMFRFPTVHDSRIAFVYAGDLWTVSKNGGTARRLTSDVGYECFPRYSPDGSLIAFTGQQDGNTEVMVMPSDGGVPKRITYTATLGRDQISDRMGPNNLVMTWKDNDEIVYRSRKQSFNDFKGHLFVSRINGGLSEQLPFSVGGFCSYSPDGNKMAMNRVFREFRTWKYYRGGMADDIWIFDMPSKQWSNITNNNAQDLQPMWSGNKIYYLSDRDRTMNLFVYDVTTQQTRKITNYTDYDIKFPSLGDQDIVFEKGGELYLLNLQTEQVSKVNIRLNDDQSWSRTEWVDASKFIEGSDLSPDGNRLAFVARGDVFTVPAQSGFTRNLTQTNGFHERNAVWSPDGKWIAYISDASGEDEIYVKGQKGEGDAQRLTSNGDNYKYYLRWSPDSKHILWADRKQNLQYVNVESKQITLIEHSDVFEYSYYDWSPDSKWICYVRPEWQTQNRIFIYHLASKTSTAVTDRWYNSYEPTFSRDGKYLMLLSDRDFNPSFSSTEFQIAYQNMTKIYLVTLSKETPSPFAPQNDEVKPREEPDVQSTTGGSTKKSSSQSKKDESKPKTADQQPAPADVKIDLDGLQDRMVALPIEAAQYFNIQSQEGNIYYQKAKPGQSGSSLMMYKTEDRKEEELGAYDGYQISADGKKMSLQKGSNYYVIDLPRGKIQADKTVDLSNMKVMVNKHEEWQAIFNESWRQMRDFFYAPNMHGIDWNAMKQKYGSLVPYVNHRADLSYVLGEMIGELNIGHAYVGGGDEPKPGRIQTGLLGAQLSRDASGYYRIDQILRGANWNSSLRSPLTEIGVNVKEGDFIIAVNGAATNRMDDVYAALANTAGKQVELTVNSKPSAEGSKKVVVVPISDESDLYYYNWVQRNIAYVDSATGGKAGYLHIPNMGVEGLNEFIKHFYPQLNKKALIVDDRGNGGGFVSGLVAQRLAAELVYYNMARNTIGSTDPGMLLGPKVLLVDRYSASDGDIIAYRFKKYKLGKVIGVRTWGGTVGIRGSLPTMDGGYLMRPEFAPYDEQGWAIEGHGVDPDIVIDNDPYLEFMGKDQQLDRAIAEILLDLKTQEKNVPPVPAFPDKTK